MEFKVNFPEYLPAHFNLINNNDRNMARKSKTVILAENFIESLKNSDATKKYYLALRMEELISICYKKDRYLYNTILNMVVDHSKIYEYGVKVGDEMSLEEYLKDVISMVLVNSIMINSYCHRILYLTCNNNKKEDAE